MLLLSAALEAMRASCVCGHSILTHKVDRNRRCRGGSGSFRTLVLLSARDLRAAYPDEPIHRRFHAVLLMTTTGELSGFLVRAFPRRKTSRF
jgi:hypothetical protein